MKKAGRSIVGISLCLLFITLFSCKGGGGGHDCDNAANENCINDCHNTYSDIYGNNECVWNCYKSNHCDSGCTGSCHEDCRDLHAFEYSYCFSDCVDSNCGAAEAQAQEKCDTENDFYYFEEQP